MFASIFLISLFSASLASSFVVNRLKTGITGPNDLPRARIATVAGSAGETLDRRAKLHGRSYPFVIQASKALQRGDVNALIHEKAILGHMIKEYGWRELHMLPHTLAVWGLRRHRRSQRQSGRGSNQPRAVKVDETAWDRKERRATYRQNGASD